MESLGDFMLKLGKVEAISLEYFYDGDKIEEFENSAALGF